MSARFNSCFAKLAVTQVYAPTNGADDESKEEQLQRDVETTPRHDVLIVMGDLNATESATTMKVGRRWWDDMAMNENWERLAMFCGDNDLMIGGSLLKHRHIRGPPQMQEIGIKSTRIISSSVVDIEVRWWTPEQWEGLMPTGTITWWWERLGWSYAAQRGWGRRVPSLTPLSFKIPVSMKYFGWKWATDSRCWGWELLKLRERSTMWRVARVQGLMASGSAELLKFVAEDAMKQLHLLFSTVWRERSEYQRTGRSRHS